MTVLIGLLLFGAGCSSYEPIEYEYVAIHGRVTCNGSVVKAGDVRFSPVAKSPHEKDFAQTGAPAYASIQPDGTYVLITNAETGTEMGAVIGKHRISIKPAMLKVTEVLMVDDEDSLKAQEWEEEAEEEGFDNPLMVPLPCPEVKNLAVTLTAEDSVINIEMSGGGKLTTGDGKSK